MVKVTDRRGQARARLEMALEQEVEMLKAQMQALQERLAAKLAEAAALRPAENYEWPTSIYL